jgi:hypothetical protein
MMLCTLLSPRVPADTQTMMAHLNLLFKKILLVKKKDDAGVLEPVILLKSFVIKLFFH